MTNEHNSVKFFVAVGSAGGLALCLWGGLLSRTVLLGFQATGATTRILLARTACAAVGKDGHPMRWLALFAFVVGSFLDLVVSTHSG